MKELHIQPSELAQMSNWLKKYYAEIIRLIKTKEKEEFDKGQHPKARSYSWVGKDKRERIKQRQTFVLDKLNNLKKK